MWAGFEWIASVQRNHAAPSGVHSRILRIPGRERGKRLVRILNTNKAGGSGAISSRPSLRATFFGACVLPALLCKADQHHRRRWLLALSSLRVNEKSPVLGLPE